MNTRLLTAVYLALMIAPFLSIAAIAPYVLVTYRKTRAIHMVRCADLYLMVFFTLCAYFTTMLPFPTMESVRAMTGPSVQLIPFYCVYDFFTNSGVNLSELSTILPALGGSIFLGVVLNIIMLMPAGFFLRALYPTRLRRALLIGFCVSLFFELTQLSGLFFIYPRPYRLFDADDLIQNTLGFCLGFMLQPAANRFLPSATARRMLRQGGEVSLRRRLLSDLIDQTIAVAVTAVLVVVLQRFVLRTELLRSAKGVPFCFLCYLIVSMGMAVILRRGRGRSPGMRLTGLRLRGIREDSLTLRQCVLRQVIYGVISALPLWIGWFIQISSVSGLIRGILCGFAVAVCTFGYVCFLLQVFLNVITHGEPLPFEYWTKTRLGFDPEAKAVRGAQNLHVGPLDENGIAPGVDTVLHILESQGIDRHNAMRVQFLAEGVLLDWMENGLRGSTYDVALTKRLLHRTVVISIPGPEVPCTRQPDSFIEMLSGTRLSFDTYYTGGTNVFAIDVP